MVRLDWIRTSSQTPLLPLGSLEANPALRVFRELTCADGVRNLIFVKMF